MARVEVGPCAVGLHRVKRIASALTCLLGVGDG